MFHLLRLSVCICVIFFSIRFHCCCKLGRQSFICTVTQIVLSAYAPIRHFLSMFFGIVWIYEVNNLSVIRVCICVFWIESIIIIINIRPSNVVRSTLSPLFFRYSVFIDAPSYLLSGFGMQYTICWTNIYLAKHRTHSHAIHFKGYLMWWLIFFFSFARRSYCCIFTMDFYDLQICSSRLFYLGGPGNRQIELPHFHFYYRNCVKINRKICMYALPHSKIEK